MDRYYGREHYLLGLVEPALKINPRAWSYHVKLGTLDIVGELATFLSDVAPVARKPQNCYQRRKHSLIRSLDTGWYLWSKAVRGSKRQRRRESRRAENRESRRRKRRGGAVERSGEGAVTHPWKCFLLFPFEMAHLEAHLGYSGVLVLRFCF